MIFFLRFLNVWAKILLVRVTKLDKTVGAIVFSLLFRVSKTDRKVSAS